MTPAQAYKLIIGELIVDRPVVSDMDHTLHQAWLAYGRKPFYRKWFTKSPPKRPSYLPADPTEPLNYRTPVR